MVKKTVNQDDPTVYHLFYADEAGTPGSDITFFEYPVFAAAAQAPGWCTPCSGAWVGSRTRLLGEQARGGGRRVA